MVSGLLQKPQRLDVYLHVSDASTIWYRLPVNSLAIMGVTTYEVKVQGPGVLAASDLKCLCRGTKA